SERGNQPRHALLRAPEREPGKVHGHGHEPDVEEVVVPLEPPSRILGQVRPDEDRLRGLQVHVAARIPYRESLLATAACPVVEPPAEVRDDDALLDGGVGGERAGREVGRHPAAQVPVVLAEHVDEVVLAEELLPERGWPMNWNASGRTLDSTRWVSSVSRTNTTNLPRK
ncbi:hypothetical protein EJB05_32555, partial [Eragrostis curvula]